MRGHGKTYEECSAEVRIEVDLRHSYMLSWRESGLTKNAFFESHPVSRHGWNKNNFYRWARAWERSGGERDSLLRFVNCCGPIAGKAADWGTWTRREIELALQLLGLTAVSVAERIGAKKNTVHRVISRQRTGGDEAQRVAVAVRRIVEEGLSELTAKRKVE